MVFFILADTVKAIWNSLKKDFDAARKSAPEPRSGMSTEELEFVPDFPFYESMQFLLGQSGVPTVSNVTLRQGMSAPPPTHQPNESTADIQQPQGGPRLTRGGRASKSSRRGGRTYNLTRSRRPRAVQPDDYMEYNEDEEFEDEDSIITTPQRKKKSLTFDEKLLELEKQRFISYEKLQLDGDRQFLLSLADDLKYLKYYYKAEAKKEIINVLTKYRMQQDQNDQMLNNPTTSFNPPASNVASTTIDTDFLDQITSPSPRRGSRTPNKSTPRKRRRNLN